MTDIEKLTELLRPWTAHLSLVAAKDLISNGVTFAKDTETRVFDKEEIYHNCTVQVLTNTVTGEVSVGWWRNDKPPMGETT